MPPWWHEPAALGVTPAQAALALATALAAWLAITLGLRLALVRIGRFAERTSNQADNALVEVLAGTNRGLIAVAALLIGAGMLALPERWSDRVNQLWFGALVLQAALWANRLVGIVLRRHLERQGPAGVRAGSAAATLVSWGVRTLLWAVVLLTVLSNLGVNITAFVASLGVGGIAVALAAQTVLGDLFASLSIAIDKPFEVGDFITAGSIAGSVERIGVKTTRLRSVVGEQVVVSNTELLKQTINNFKRLQQRRVIFTLNVAYGIAPELAEQIPAIVADVVAAGASLRHDRTSLKSLGENGLVYEVVYSVLSADFDLHMREQQRINLGLLRAFAERGIAFGLPARRVHVAAAH